MPRLFMLSAGNDDDPQVCYEADLKAANPENPDGVFQWMKRAAVGDTFHGGGGAAAEYTLTRVADDYRRPA